MRLIRFGLRGVRVYLYSFVFMFILGLSICAAASASSYYINNQVTCSDTYQGTQQTHTTGTTGPWCNVSTASVVAFAAGDTINLARGAAWTGQTMTFTESGSSGSPITIQAYGSGNRPKLLGNSLATDRLIKLTNPSYWNFSDLDLGNAGTGILLYFTTTTHEGFSFNNIYIHNMNGIVKGVPSNSDNIFFSAGIWFGGSGLSVPNLTDYVARNISMDNIEGEHSQDVISFDFDNGAVTSWYSDGYNPVQNVTLNHLNLHDNNGGGTSSSCSDSLRLISMMNVKVLNSSSYNDAGCYSSTGTAALILGRVKDVTLVNSSITAVPYTGSYDQVAIDYEYATLNVNLRGNYFADNAGPALDLLVQNNGLEMSSNGFEHNGLNTLGPQAGSSSIFNLSGQTPTGTIRDNVYSEGSKPFATNTSSMTLTNNVGSTLALYNAIKHFSGTQNVGGGSCTSGSNCWSYQYKNGSGVWANLPSYDSANKIWYLTSGVLAQSVSRFEQTPGTSSNSDIARVWTAPSSGVISIRGRVLKSDIAGGNGVLARITKNGTRIWPAGGDQTIAYNDQSGYDANLDSVTVTPGDIIRFEVGNNGSGANDTTSWTPSIAYSSTDSAISYVYDWGFNTNGNSEGWTNGNEISQSVSGGINTLTISGGDPYIFSSDNLNISSSAYKNVRVRMKNGTSSTIGEVFFTTNTDTTFTQAKSTRVTLIANDSGYTEYVYDLSTNAAWTGTIKQLRIDPVADYSGTVYLDYVRVANRGPSGTGLELDVTNSFAAVANRYIYKKFSNVGYTFQAGDYIEYDVKLLTNTTYAGGIDITNTDGSYFRDSSGWADQNGAGGHPGSDLTAYANNQWYHRKLAVPFAMIGKTSSYWVLAGENDTTSLVYKAQYDNIVVTRAGSVISTAFASSADYNLTGDALTSGVTASSIATSNVP